MSSSTSLKRQLLSNAMHTSVDARTPFLCHRYLHWIESYRITRFSGCRFSCTRKLNRNCTATAKCIHQWNCSLIYLILFTDVKQVAVESRKWIKIEHENECKTIRADSNKKCKDLKLWKVKQESQSFSELSHDNDNELNSSATMWR